MRFYAGLAILLAALTMAAQVPGGAPAQADGSAVFTRACATCHQPGQTQVPTPDALRAFSPEAIVNALTNGKMSVQGSGLSTAERAAVAQFLTGRAPAAAATGTGALANRCTTPTPTLDPTRGPAWMTWGNDASNSRYAPQGGLTAADVPRLKLKWA